MYISNYFTVHTNIYFTIFYIKCHVPRWQLSAGRLYLFGSVTDKKCHLVQHNLVKLSVITQIPKGCQFLDPELAHSAA